MEYIRLKKDLVIRKTSDGLFLFNPIQESSLLLNSTGAEIIQLLSNEKGVSLDALITNFTISYPHITPITIQTDIYDCLNTLEKMEFIDIIPEKNFNFIGLKQLHIEITQKCNERCIHCYIPNYVKDNNLSINYSTLIKTLIEFVQMGGEEIVLTGGEPFTYPHLDKIIEFCLSHRLKVSFLTNLIDADMEMIFQLHSKGLLGFVQTSVYSMRPAIHDRITKVGHSLERTLINLEHLLENGIEVSISTPIMSQNKDEIGEIMEYAQNKGIGFRANADIIAQKDGNKDFVNKYALSHDEISECYSNLITTYGRYAFSHILHHKDCDKLFCEHPEIFIKNNVCSCGTDSLCIDVNGNILPCPQWDKMILGNITTDSIEYIWEKSNILESIRNINKRSSFPQCLRCEALDYCKNCLMRNAQSTYSQMNIPDENNCAIAHLAKKIYESPIMDNERNY